MDEVAYEAYDVDLALLQAALQDTRLKWVYAERLEEIVLTGWDSFLKSNVPLSSWTHGRAFSPDLEICWWMEADRGSIRCITSEHLPEGIVWYQMKDAAGWQVLEDTSLLLIGKRDIDRDTSVPSWSAARIPHYLTYPVEDTSGEYPERVALMVRFCCERGVVVTQRWVEIAGWSDGTV